MSRAMRMFWMSTILCFVSGCSSFGVVYGPGGDEMPSELDWTNIVDTGESVRVTLEESGPVEGKVESRSVKWLGVKTERQSGFLGRRSTALVTIGPDARVIAIEKRRFNAIKTLALLGIIAAPIVVIAATVELDMSINTGFQ